MTVTELDIQGAYLIKPEFKEDRRGFFMRIYCKEEIGSYDISTDYVQWSISKNTKKNTLRGMHYQAYPCEETKWVSCLKGAALDVILDLRENSPSYKKWVSVIIDDVKKESVYIPKGVAHGFKTLVDNTEILYHISTFYQPEYSRGVLYNDPRFQIGWGDLEGLVISEKDLCYDIYAK